MQLLKDMQTEQGQKRFRADMSAETNRILSDIREQKKANGGRAKAPRRAWL